MSSVKSHLLLQVLNTSSSSCLAILAREAAVESIALAKDLPLDGVRLPGASDLARLSLLGLRELLGVVDKTGCLLVGETLFEGAL